MWPEHTTHSVFLYAPSIYKIGRYVINGLTASDVVDDKTERQYSAVVSAQSDGSSSSMVVAYSTITQVND